MSIEVDQFLLKDMVSEDDLNTLFDILESECIDLLYDDEKEDPFETIFNKDISEYEYDESLEESVYIKEGDEDGMDDDIYYSPTELEIIDLAAEDEEDAIDSLIDPSDTLTDQTIDTTADLGGPEGDDIYFLDDEEC